MEMTSFNTVPRLVHGAGCLETLGEEIGRLGGGKVFLVSDAGLKAAGLVEPVIQVLERAGLAWQAWDQGQPDPSVEAALACGELGRQWGPSVVVGLGGGSSLDLAKAASVVMGNPGPLADYFGMELVPRPGPPLILIPTTAGTGSEVTSISVLTDPATQGKQGLVSRHLYARVALLDPVLTLGLPPQVTAHTGLDALSHAMESFTGRRRSGFTHTLNRGALELIGANLRTAYAQGDNLAARENMLQASCLAGMAFSNTQNALAHALANAIGGRHHLPHGLLTGFITPWVMEFNLSADPAIYAQAAAALGQSTSGLSPLEAGRLAVSWMRQLVSDLGISGKLSDYGIAREELPALAQAALGARRLIDNNPRPVSQAQVIELLETNY